MVETPTPPKVKEPKVETLKPEATVHTVTPPQGPQVQPPKDTASS